MCGSIITSDPTYYLLDKRDKKCCCPTFKSDETLELRVNLPIREADIFPDRLVDNLLRLDCNLSDSVDILFIMAPARAFGGRSHDLAR